MRFYIEGDTIFFSTIHEDLGYGFYHRVAYTYDEKGKLIHIGHNTGHESVGHGDVDAWLKPEGVLIRYGGYGH